MEVWRGTQDWETVQEELIATGISDGLPVVPPTAERVARMLERNGYSPNQVITILPPSYAEVTWQGAAINAVMAGCRPEYLPVIGAALQAMAADEFNLLGIGTTTGSAAPVFIVNGPIVAELNLNGGGNALGPGNRANATIGRAISLCLRNLGGAKPGEVDMSTLGQPAKYTCCLAENEADSPWTALHVDRGFDKSENVITVCGASGTIEMVDSVNSTGAGIAQTYAQSMLIAGICGASGYIGGGQPLILMPPEIAMSFQRDGHTKEQAKAAIFERAIMPLERLSPAIAERISAMRESEGLGDPAAPLRIAEKPDDIIIVVAGGIGVKAAYVPAWGTTKSVSKPIRRGH